MIASNDDASADGDVRVSTAGAVLTVTLCRAARKNAFTEPMYQALADALDRLADDDALRCLVIAAEGNVFSAGNDLHDFLAQDDLHATSPVVRVLRALGSAEKPLVAVVDGAAIGIGTTLLLHCDVVIATPAAKFGAPFVSLGLVPEAGSSQLLPALIGHRRSMDMFLLGHRMDADEALACGLISRCVSADAIDDTLATVTSTLCALPQRALHRTKQLCRAAPAPIGEVIDREIAEFGARLRSPETREAIQAVLSGNRSDSKPTT